MPVRLMSKILPKSSSSQGAHSPVTPDPDRELNYTQSTFEPYQDVDAGELSDQATLAFYKTNILRKLQQDYNELFTNLVEEVKAQKYDISQESRSRIECQISIARSNEFSQLDLMASTTSALRYSSYRRCGKAQESNDTASHTIIRDHDNLQATCVAPAQTIKSDMDNTDPKSDPFELIQRSQTQERQSLMVITPNTRCLCPYKYCKRSQGRGFSQPCDLAQHMRQVHTEVPANDERDNQPSKSFLPKLPPWPEDVVSNNTPSVSASARPAASKVREHQSTPSTKSSEPPTDLASQRARLGQYTKSHTLPTVGRSGGGVRGAYDTIGVAKTQPPPKPDGSKQQKSKPRLMLRNDCPVIDYSSRSTYARDDANDVRYFSRFAGGFRLDSPRGTSHRPYQPQKPVVSTRPAKGTGQSKRTTAGRQSLSICLMSGEPAVKQSGHDRGGPLGGKPTVPDLLALWTTVRDI